MAFGITDIVMWLFKDASKYIMYLKKAFLTAMPEKVVGNSIVTKTTFGKFLLLCSFPLRRASGRILKMWSYHQFFLQ